MKKLSESILYELEDTEKKRVDDKKALEVAGMIASFATQVEKSFKGARAKFELSRKPSKKIQRNISDEPYIDGFTYMIYIGGTIFQFIVRTYNYMDRNSITLDFEQNGNSYGGAEDNSTFTIEKAQQLLKITETAWNLINSFEQALTQAGVNVQVGKGNTSGSRYEIR